MSHNLSAPEQAMVAPLRAGVELVLISVLVLFLELACIRWFPAHVLFLTFFTNIVLLASFLGISLGCLAASHRRNYLAATPAWLGLGVMAALGVEVLHINFGQVVGVESQESPQLVYFGTEQHATDLARFIIPVEVVGAFFFVVIALVFIGPGQVLGRALNNNPNRVRAYTLNILGSIAGIGFFAASSWWELPPFWWFLAIEVGLGYFLFRRPWTTDHIVRGTLLALVLAATTLRSGTWGTGANIHQHFWSPYYRIDFSPRHLSLRVNQIGHQAMHGRDKAAAAYALPHLLNRDSGAAPFANVLVIGAGSGNDVSRALLWGAQHVDAVEIDPVIQRIGRLHHPDRPYQNERVTVYLDDGRNFLRSTERRYDLIVYALVDSLVLHSSYSNLRLESYLFTDQAFADVRKLLKPGGVFVMYNYFRQGWLVARLHKGLTETFETEPLVLGLPPRDAIRPEDTLFGEFTIFMTGDLGRLRQAFNDSGDYWLSNKELPSPISANGFHHPTPEERRLLGGPAPPGEPAPWLRFHPAQVHQPEEPLRIASDDWPFLYLRRPMIPALSLRSAAIMGGLALVLLFLFLPKRSGSRASSPLIGRMFFLGAGFMLVETKAVVQMALLFGSTWMVNTVVFFAVLVMILAANLFVLAVRPRRLWPWYVGLLAALSLNCVVPLDFFLGMERTAQILASCLLVFTPMAFAGVIFAVSFGRSVTPDRDFAANIAGAMVGGLAEYASMLLGFQLLTLLATAFYGLSALFNNQEARDLVRPEGTVTSESREPQQPGPLL